MLTLNEATHEYTEDGRKLISVTQVLDLNGLYKGTEYFTPESRELGTAIHQACEFYDRGIFDDYEWDPKVIPFVESWKEFRAVTGFTPILTEQLFSSKVYGFAGRTDSIGEMKKENWIIDWKHGSDQPAHRYQTAGYHLLLAESHHMQELATKRIRRGTVFLQANGSIAKLKPHNDIADIQKFMCLLVAAQIRQELGVI